MFIVVLILLTHIPMEKHIFQLGYNASIQFLLLLILQSICILKILFSMYFLGSQSATIIFICNTLRVSCHSLYFTLGQRDIMSDFFFNLHALKFTLCSMCFDKCIMLCNNPLKYYIEQFYDSENLFYLFNKHILFPKFPGTTDFPSL